MDGMEVDGGDDGKMGSVGSRSDDRRNGMKIML